MFRTLCTVAWTVAVVVAIFVTYMQVAHTPKLVMVQSLLTLLLIFAWAPLFFMRFWEWVTSVALPMCLLAGLILLSVYHPFWSVLFWVLILGTLSWLAREEYLDTPHPRDTSLTGIKIPRRGVVMISMAGRTPRDINDEIRCYRRNARLCK